jgi:hypothetical protein
LVEPSWAAVPATIDVIWQTLDPAILVSFGFDFVADEGRPVTAGV